MLKWVCKPRTEVRVVFFGGVAGTKLEKKLPYWSKANSTCPNRPLLNGDLKGRWCNWITLIPRSILISWAAVSAHVYGWVMVGYSNLPASHGINNSF